MHVTVSPLVLLVALAFLVPWSTAWTRFRGRLMLAEARWIRRRLERELGVRILVYTGTIERRHTFGLCRRIREVPIDRELVLVLDTRGGHSDAAAQVARCLASRPGRVVVRVPDEAWSSGTVIAAAADHVVLGPDANLGAADIWAEREPDRFYPTRFLAAEKMGVTEDKALADEIHASAVRHIVEARRLRGVLPEQAEATARALTAFADHVTALRAEQLQAMGLSVSVAEDARWNRLVTCYSWSRL